MSFGGEGEHTFLTIRISPHLSPQKHGNENSTTGLHLCCAVHPSSSACTLVSSPETVTPCSYPLGEPWARLRSPALLKWQGGTSRASLSLGTGTWQAVRPEPRLPPARRSQATDHRGSPRGPSKAGSLSAPPAAVESHLTGRWARPPARGRHRARAARPRRTSPPCGFRSRCPRRGLFSWLAATAETRAQAQARHSPMSTASSRARQSPPLARARQAGTRRLGGTRPRAVPAAPFPGGRTDRDVTGPRHPPRQPSLPGE